MRKLRVPFGLHVSSGRIVDVSVVGPGIRCNCVCPECGARLVAKKEHTTPHFAHESEADCSAGLETSIHKAAKQILVEEKKLWLPSLSYIVRDPKLPLHFDSEIEHASSAATTLDEVRLEVNIGPIVPDALCRVGTRILAFEVEVTHPVDEMKKAEYRRQRLSAVALDLSEEPKLLTLQALTQAIIAPDRRKRWIYNSREEEMVRVARETAVRREVVLHRSRFRRFPVPHVANCPLRHRFFNGVPFANIVEDCKTCRFVTQWGWKFIKCAEKQAKQPQLPPGVSLDEIRNIERGA